MAETIAKTDLPAHPKEREAALNAMLKPLGRSRGRRLCRSAPGGAAFGRGGQEACEPGDRGRLLAGPLEDAANHWAVESASLQLTAYEAGEAAHGAGRAIEFAKRGEPWRPSNVEEDVDALIAAQWALAR
jgi:hypothetical protein